VLGHDAKARENPTFQELLRRGVEWAATGEAAAK
jgi:type 1 glutamine amidotransferase